MESDLSLKRLFDILFSAFVLILLSPLLTLISLGILLSSQGSILYSQERLGRGGKKFKCLKFRTMHQNAEVKLRELLQDEKLQVEWREKQKLLEDPRVFPLGRFLRKTSLDELPQFWNVLRGELSVVGPRPYMIEQKEEIGLFAQKILSTRPGITGLWQTSGRSSTSFKQRISLDAEYIDKRSFGLDLLLIVKTIPRVFFPKDAY